VDCDDPIEQSDKDKDQSQGEIIEKRIEIQIANQSSSRPMRKTAPTAIAATSHLLSQTGFGSIGR
jgi:hypothetical protein